MSAWRLFELIGHHLLMVVSLCCGAVRLRRLMLFVLSRNLAAEQEACAKQRRGLQKLTSHPIHLVTHFKTLSKPLIKNPLVNDISTLIILTQCGASISRP